MEKVSVVMNVYGEKKEDFLKETENILNQKECDIQLIVSTVTDDSCINWVTKEMDLVVSKKGERSPVMSCYQLNEGVKLVKGDWYFWVSCNDITIRNKSITEIRRCREMGKKICSSDFYIMNSEGQLRKTYEVIKYDYSEHLKRNFIPDRAIIHKSLFKYFPFASKWYNCGYWDFWLRVYENEGDVFCRTKEVGWTYNDHLGSMHIKRRSEPETVKMYDRHRKQMLKTHIK